VVQGFQTQVFRYANVYGPWQDGTGEAGVVAIFSEAMLGNRPLKINGDGEQTRDYVYVGDLAEAASRAARSDESGIWNLGTGVETSVNRLFGLLAKEYGYTANPPHVPAPAGEQMRSVLDGSRVRRDFELPPWTPLEDGLKKTAEFFRARHRAGGNA
jgi:UDP-glucose 4-epimerase